MKLSKKARRACARRKLIGITDAGGAPDVPLLEALAVVLLEAVDIMRLRIANDLAALERRRDDLLGEMDRLDKMDEGPKS